MDNIIADTIHYLHIVLVVYVLTGWVITPIRKIHYYILFVLFILLDWNDLDGECFLTRLEHYFRGRAADKHLYLYPSNNKKITINAETGEPEFFRPLMNIAFNIDLTSQEATRINYFTFVSVILLAFLRMLHHYNIIFISDIYKL